MTRRKGFVEHAPLLARHRDERSDAMARLESKPAHEQRDADRRRHLVVVALPHRDPLAAGGLATRKGTPVKILGQGDISKKLTVRAHAFSKTAREKIEGAGGTCAILDE